MTTITIQTKNKFIKLKSLFISTCIVATSVTVSHAAVNVIKDLSITSNAYQYASYYSDLETGLEYLKARYRSVKFGFISKDDYDLLNKYNYVGGNPVNNIDPTGHDLECIGGIGGLIGTTIGSFIVLFLIGFGIYKYKKSNIIRYEMRSIDINNKAVTVTLPLLSNEQQLNHAINILTKDSNISIGYSGKEIYSIFTKIEPTLFDCAEAKLATAISIYEILKEFKNEEFELVKKKIENLEKSIQDYDKITSVADLMKNPQANEFFMSDEFIYGSDYISAKEAKGQFNQSSLFSPNSESNPDRNPDRKRKDKILTLFHNAFPDVKEERLFEKSKFSQGSRIL